MMLNVILIDQAINVKCSSRDRPDYLFKKNTPEIIVRIFPTPSIRSFRRNKPRSKKKTKGKKIKDKQHLFLHLAIIISRWKRWNAVWCSAIPSSSRAVPSNQRVSRKNAACIRLVKSDAHREAQFLTDVRAARHLRAAGREGDRPILRERP